VAERDVVVDEHLAFALLVPQLLTRAARAEQDRADGEPVARDAGTVTAAFCVARSGAWDAVAARELHGDVINAFEADDVQVRPWSRRRELVPVLAERLVGVSRIRID